MDRISASYRDQGGYTRERTALPFVFFMPKDIKNRIRKVPGTNEQGVHSDKMIPDRFFSPEK